MAEFELELDESELNAVVSQILPFCSPDERYGKGMVAVTARAGRRRWWSTDNYRMARLDGGADEGDYLLIVSPRLLAAWPLAAGSGSTVTLSINEPSGRRPDEDDDGSRLTVISGQGGSFSAPLLPATFPPTDEFAAQYDLQEGPSAVVDALGLKQLVVLGRDAPSGPFLQEGLPEPTFWLTIEHGTLNAKVDWRELGTNTHTLRAVTNGVGHVAVNPRFLAEAVEVLGPDDAVVRLPKEENLPLIISQGDFTTYVMPFDETLGIVGTVEDVLEECFGTDVRVPNSEGDYELSSYGVPVHARVEADDPVRLRIFAEVISGIDESPELMSELNALNLAYGFVKVLWKGDALLVEGDLVAETIDPPEVTALFERVRHVAEELGPSLAAVYGGTSTQRGDIARWVEYLRCAIVVHVGPGNVVDLTGRLAQAKWPFEGLVHVLTAWDPAGRRRPQDVNAEQNALLAADLMRAGASVLRADGFTLGEQGESGVTGAEFVDTGFLVWNLETDLVLRIAADYGQEAIYRLGEESMEVLGTMSNRREERPRLAFVANSRSEDSRGDATGEA